MQHIFRLFIAVFLTLAGTALFAGNVPAARQTSPLETEYRKTAEDWRTLLRDDKKAALRDPWLAVEKRFLAIAAKDPKGDMGAKGQYQAGRSREELAKRSFLDSDWRQAANHYLDLGKKYPRHNLADDGLFQAAFIAAKRLGKPEEARETAQAILDRYPKGDMAQNALELLASLPKNPASAQRGAGGKRPPAPPETAGKPVPAASSPAPQTASQASALARVFCRGTSKSSTVILELDGAAPFRHQYLAAAGKQPARLVVDIDGVALRPDVKPSVIFTGMTASRARASVTGGKGKKGVRVVIDLGNVRHYTVDTGANPPGIYVQSSISRDLAGGRTPPTGGNGPVVQGRFSALVPGQPGTLMEQLGLTVKTIMIDAGHGGKDPGAMGNGITEKDVTLDLAKMLGDKLRKQGFTVLYTRQNDTFVALDQRAVLGNNKKADLFISLHVNSSTDKKTNGLETYFLDLARTSSAATVAARENAVSVKNISDLQFILTDLMLTSKLQESQDLAATVHKGMLTRLKQAGFTMNDNGVRSAPFYVLMGARMPAVLVEVGYLSHAEDSRRIKSDKYLERLVDGIAQGIEEYKNKLARFSGK